ncbi:hypothetical protein [Streptomyces sp. KR55]|uniref:hypothetical protein n=1 Tax=Streptomyces sp. KR55 TaxID=3457425 RepID=UPI003FD1A963
MDLQRRLDALLSADGPQSVNSCGQMTPVARYFTDLRIMATLILASWPEASPYAATPALAQAIGREAEQRLRDSRRRTSAASKRPYGISSLFAPLESSLTTGAVLGIAEQLLDARDKRWTRLAVGPLLRATLALNKDAFQDLVSLPGASMALHEVFGVVMEAPPPEIPIRGPRNG